jgi:hypothetical protein
VRLKGGSGLWTSVLLLPWSGNELHSTINHAMHFFI